MGAFEFGVPFQKLIVKLALTDKEFFVQAKQRVGSKNFSTAELQFVWDVMTSFQNMPSRLEFLDAVGAYSDTMNYRLDEEELVESVSDLLDARVSNPQYIKGRISEFVRAQAWVDSIGEAIGLMERNELDQIDAVMRRAAAVSLVEDTGIRFLTGDRETCLVDRSGAVPLLIPEIDSRFWALPKTLNILMGAPNVGKSWGLVHVGKAGVLTRHKTAHYTLEMSKEHVVERYEKAFTGLSDVTDRKLVNKRLKTLFPDTREEYLVIKEFPTKGAKVTDVKAHILSLCSDGFIPELVVVDYGDILAPSRKGEKRHELSGIFEDLRGMSAEFNAVVWTGTQTTRAATNRAFVDITDIAEDYSKAATADNILVLCQTQEEEEKGVMRVFGAKVRTQKRRWTVEVRNDFSRGQFASRVIGRDKLDQRTERLRTFRQLRVAGKIP